MPFFDKFKKKDEISEQRRQELLAKVIPIIAKELDIAREKIKPESRIVEDLGADSLDAIEIVMGLEDGFGIEIADEDAEKILTIEDIVRYLDKKLSN